MSKRPRGETRPADVTGCAGSATGETGIARERLAFEMIEGGSAA